jgi:hypothetical protein
MSNYRKEIMKIKKIIAVAVVGMTLTGCGIYNKYEQKTESPADLFGSAQDVQTLSSGESLAQMSWR